MLITQVTRYVSLACGATVVQKKLLTAIKIGQIWKIVLFNVKIYLPIPTGYPECGTRSLSSPSSRIVGGREARPNSWPWQVDLLINGTTHHCGGSLIGPSWVVTSAHCFYRNKRPDQWQVRVGEHNETKYEGYEEMIDIQRIIIHPGFFIGSEIHTGDYDIAIIKLKRPAVFHKRVHSICLPNMETSFPAGKTCYATGWGKQHELAPTYSEVLREVDVELVAREVCNSNISYNGMLNERYMCAGFQGGGKDSCFGDSGGPLACESENGSFVLTGVVSWGEGCARPNKYGVYLEVRYMLPFIESTLHGKLSFENDDDYDYYYYLLLFHASLTGYVKRIKCHYRKTIRLQTIEYSYFSELKPLINSP